MSHVDEGTIHAWLDGAFAPDDPEFTRIEEHLGACEACRRAVDVERRIRGRAADVLAAAAPDAVRVEPFQRILDARRSRERTGEAEAQAHAERTGAGSGSSIGAGGRGVASSPETDIDAGGAGEAGFGGSGNRGRGFRIPMALAATLVLAIGATWFARQMMPDRGAAPEIEMMDEAAEGDAAANSVATPRPGAPAESERLANEAARLERAVGDAASREETPPPAIQSAPTVVAEAQVGATAVAGGRSTDTAAAPPAAGDLRNRTPEETRRLRDAVLGVAAVPPPAPSRFADADAVIAVDRLQEEAGTVVWTLADPDTVAARLGMRPLGLAGLDADSVQLGSVGGATVARLVYTVEGQPIELLQWVTGSVNAETGQFRALELRQERRVVSGEGVRDDAAAAKAVAPVAPAAFRLHGIDFVLRGGMSADSLAALATRVGRIE